MEPANDSARGGEPIACRLLPHTAADGPANMALDEALFDLVAAAPNTAALRTYCWTTPTLSLGYFQSLAEVELDARWRGVPLVRRFTGGGAILHDREITYAVCVSRACALARSPSALYQAVHAAIADLLEERQIPAKRRGASSGKKQRERRFLCFTDQDPEDIVLRGAKIVGSAQRRRCGAVLQHGSLLLGRSSLTPELPGLIDLAAVDATPQTWSAWLATEIPRSLGFVVQECASSALLRERAFALEERVYRNPSWTQRR
jgi:lipoyl(octanoyl) transferase